MNWTELLKSEAEEAYRAAEGLLDLVDDDALGWKPATGDNWMTTGQLVLHVTNAFGQSSAGFVTGDWGLPEGVDVNNLPPEMMMPPAESMPAAESVASARELLAADKRTGMEMIDQAADRMDEGTPAPWDPRPLPLGERLLQMIGHLNNHKAQLFYYLKLQGKPVNTWHLYGMSPDSSA